jgi:hypothetical protein
MIMGRSCGDPRDMRGQKRTSHVYGLLNQRVMLATRVPAQAGTQSHARCTLQLLGSCLRASA